MTTGDRIENYEGGDTYTVSECIVVAYCLIDELVVWIMDLFGLLGYLVISRSVSRV